MSMGEQIKTARQLRGFTQEELGERCGIGAANIRKYESGKQIPRIVTLQKSQKPWIYQSVRFFRLLA